MASSSIVGDKHMPTDVPSQPSTMHTEVTTSAASATPIAHGQDKYLLASVRAYVGASVQEQGKSSDGDLVGSIDHYDLDWSACYTGTFGCFTGVTLHDAAVCYVRTYTDSACAEEDRPATFEYNTLREFPYSGTQSFQVYCRE